MADAFGLGHRIEPYVRQHLAKVYMVLAATIASTAVGALLQMANIIDLDIFGTLASLAFVLGLHYYKNGKNYYVRLGMLYAFGFCCGQVMGPLLGYVSSIDSATIVTALTGTLVTFVSLSLGALLAEQGRYLYLGGTLGSVVSSMAMFSLFNMIFKSFLGQIRQLYIGVFVMAAFIVYDTQNIVQKCRNGDRDVIQHALDLFFDLISMFRRLLVILNQKQQRHKSN